MDPQLVRQRDACFDSIEESVTTNNINRLTEIINQDEPRVVLSALRKVEGGRNLVMQAVAMERFDMVLVMMDMLERGVTAFKYWTSDEYAEYLCSLDNNGNNLLQLLIIHGPRHSDMMPQRVISHINTHNRRRLRDLVNNKNNEDKDSHDLANEHNHEQKGNMRAVIFINKERDSESDAEKLDGVLLSRGFCVKHLNHTDWDRISLCMELGTHTNGNFDHLWVFGLTHGHHQHIEDHEGGSIRIEEVVRTVREAEATHSVIIIDVGQTINGDNSDTDNDSDDNSSEGAVPQGEPHLLITCSIDEEAWGEVFVHALVEHLYTDVTDVYTILQQATRDAEETSEGKERPQHVQFPRNLAEGDITLPRPTNEDQNA